MKILLVNDDGYAAQGIILLQKKLAKYGDVTVVAPKQVQSGKACAITLGQGFAVERIAPNVYAIGGTPVDCVSFGLLSLNQKFDLVVSGCNHGLNLSYDTLYSGTVGACNQALLFNKKAVAFSCDFNFDLVDRCFENVFSYILEHGLLSDKYYLNVNFPIGNIVKDIKISKLCFKKHHNFFQQKEDALFYAGRTSAESVTDETADCYMVEHGIVSITPLMNSYFDAAAYKKLVRR